MIKKSRLLLSSHRHLACLAVLCAFLGLGSVSASVAQIEGNSGLDAALADPSEVPYLQINTPDGTFYVKFFGEDDGPVELPMKGKRLTALLISSELTEQGWRVHLGAQEDVLKVTPLGRYDLVLDQEVPIRELGSLGARNWTMKLAKGEIAPDAIDGCCACGRISCCPSAGKCLGCGKCGVCCGGGAPEV